MDVCRGFKNVAGLGMEGIADLTLGWTA